MPVQFDPNKTIEQNINAIQTSLKKGEIDYQKYDEEVKDIYAAVFAMRTAAGVLRNKKSTLEVKVKKEDYEKEYKLLQGSPTFADFVKENMDSSNDIRKGHGGAAEDSFKAYVLKKERMPKDVPKRYMPACKDRIAALQEDLKKKPADSEDAIRIYSEIFRARRAVGVVYPDAERTERIINGANLDKAPDMEKNQTFLDFVEKKGDALKREIGSGFGGSAEIMFRQYVTELDSISKDVPQPYMPTAKMRTEALQDKIKSSSFAKLTDDEKTAHYVNLLAARSCVGAERKKSETLERIIEPENHIAWVNYWKHSRTLKEFVKDNPLSAKKAALSGHGGEMEDKLKTYVVDMDRFAEDMPPTFLPDGKTRVEALQKKIKAGDFNERTPEQKLDLYTQLMATREAVGAIRGEKASLESTINAGKFRTSMKKWTENKTFREFIENDPTAARSAAKDGHGGALGEKFKDYIKHLDHIPADIPTPFLPDAKERTEILQKKIKATQDTKKRAELFKELMATRACVQSVRGDKDSLERQIDAGKLNEVCSILNKSASVKNFLSRTPGDELYAAACSGHGGALDDAYTKYAAERTWTLGVVPSGVPERFRPSPDAVLQQYRKGLAEESKGKPDDWYEANADKIMKRTAQVLYMTQINAKNPSRKARREAMSHDSMTDGVQKLMEDDKFKNMFQEIGPKEAVKKMSGKNLMPLIEAYRNAPEAEPPLNPVPAVNQNEVQQQEVQPAVQPMV